MTLSSIEQAKEQVLDNIQSNNEHGGGPTGDHVTVHLSNADEIRSIQDAITAFCESQGYKFSHVCCTGKGLMFKKA